MIDLNAKFDEFEEKLNKMSSQEFDEMLIRCGIERIKSSIKSDYIYCLRRTFSDKEKEYCVNSFFKSDAYDGYHDFEMDSFEQGVA